MARLFRQRRPYRAARSRHGFACRGAAVARIHVGTAYPTAVAHARGAIWVLDYYANTLTRVDPKTNKVTGRLTVGPLRNRDDIASRLPASLMAEGHNLWVTNDDRGTVTRVIVP
jgi:DNA-binding beta-propeller fold protein YncE